jgi:hypothetical protein
MRGTPGPQEGTEGAQNNGKYRVMALILSVITAGQRACIKHHRRSPNHCYMYWLHMSCMGESAVHSVSATPRGIYRVVIVRMQHHDPTKTYVTRRTTEGKSKPDIIRCLKRLLARELWAAMRPLRTTKKTASKGRLTDIGASTRRA